MGSVARIVFLRLLLVGLFIGGYVTVWRPARDWTSANVIAPLLAGGRHAPRPAVRREWSASARP